MTVILFLTAERPSFTKKMDTYDPRDGVPCPRRSGGRDDTVSADEHALLLAKNRKYAAVVPEQRVPEAVGVNRAHRAHHTHQSASRTFYMHAAAIPLQSRSTFTPAA